MITTYNGITLYLFTVTEHSTEHTILKSRNNISLSYNDLYRGDKMKVSENIIRLKDGFKSAEIIGQTKDVEDGTYTEKGIDSIKSLLEVGALKDTENHLIIQLK